MSKLPILYGFILILFIGCSHQIKYNLNDIRKTQKKVGSNFVLSVNPLIDTRYDNTEWQDELFNIKSQNNYVCFNYEDKYGKDKIRNGLGEILANHLDSTKFFKYVAFNKPKVSDLTMNLTVSQFFGHIEINYDLINIRKSRSHLGVIGSVLMEAADTTDYRSLYGYNITYKDITIKNRHDSILLYIPTLITKDSVEIKAVTSCNDIFSLINTSLKSHNTKLSDSIEILLDK